MSHYRGMTDVTPAVSVVVCAYTLDRWRLLIRAVDSALNQTRPPLELILVIDHNDELLGAARHRFPDACVLANVEQQGLSGARNTGWVAAHGDVVAFLDDDAMAMPTWLETLAQPYVDPNVAGVGGWIVPEWADGKPEFLPEEFWWVVGCSYKGIPTQRSEVRNMLGANMSLRRSELERVGGFDIGLGRVGKHPVGCEETELCIRIRVDKPGVAILSEPKAIVHHHVPRDRSTWTYFRARCFAEGLSKAKVTRLRGGNHGLSTERSYVLRTLTGGVIAGLRESIAARRPAAAVRSLGIVVGFTWTCAGFLTGMLKTSFPSFLSFDLRSHRRV